jgi:hypothetical protein
MVKGPTRSVLPILVTNLLPVPSHLVFFFSIIGCGLLAFIFDTSYGYDDPPSLKTRRTRTGVAWIIRLSLPSRLWLELL